VDESVISEASDRLVEAVDAELAGWIERRMRALDPDSATAGDVARACADDTVRRLRDLLATDIDQQRTTPLQVVRDAMAAPTEALAAAGVPPVRRDPRQLEVEPDDVYDLGPATWADLGEDVGQAGLLWGAAKAMVHLRRHREEG
jgi:hypothetical protein